MKNVKWSELIYYLRNQKNCRIDGTGWYVPDLHKFLDKMENSISYHKPDRRVNNIHCATLKRTLRKVYDAHKKGYILEANTKVKKHFSIFGD